MFVCFWFGNARKIQSASRMQHSLGEDLLLGIVHAVKVNGHQQCAGLIVGDGAAGHALDEEGDLFGREGFPVALLSNYVLRSQVFLRVKIGRIGLIGPIRKPTAFPTIQSGRSPEQRRQVPAQPHQGPHSFWPSRLLDHDSGVYVHDMFAAFMSQRHDLGK